MALSFDRLTTTPRMPRSRTRRLVPPSTKIGTLAVLACLTRLNRLRQGFFPIHPGNALMSCGPNRLGQLRAGHAGDGRLAGRINFGDEHDLGLVECVRELADKVAGARVSVRLEEHHQTPAPSLLRG